MKGLLRARPLPLDEPSAKKVANFGDGAIQGKTPTGLKTHLRLSAVGGFCLAHGVSEYIGATEGDSEDTSKDRLKTRLKTYL